MTCSAERERVTSELYCVVTSDTVLHPCPRMYPYLRSTHEKPAVIMSFNYPSLYMSNYLPITLCFIRLVINTLMVLIRHIECNY